MSNANLAAILGAWNPVGPAQQYVLAHPACELVQLTDDGSLELKTSRGDSTIQWNSLLDQYPTLAGQFYDRVCFSSRSLNGK